MTRIATGQVASAALCLACLAASLRAQRSTSSPGQPSEVTVTGCLSKGVAAQRDPSGTSTSAASAAATSTPTHAATSTTGTASLERLAEREGAGDPAPTTSRGAPAVASEGQTIRPRL